MNYRTNSGKVIARADLLRSPHKELRQAAAHCRVAVINGVKYFPVMDILKPLGRSRVTSLPGFEVPSAESLERAKKAADEQARFNNGGKTPAPPHIDLPAVVTESSAPVLLPKPQRHSVAGRVTFLAFMTALGSLIGYQWALSIKEHQTVIAAPYCNPKVEECP